MRAFGFSNFKAQDLMRRWARGPVPTNATSLTVVWVPRLQALDHFLQLSRVAIVRRTAEERAPGRRRGLSR